jgi:hypothetical protein
MDLNQYKLSKTEWETIEIPVSSDEKEILNMIIEGFHEPNIKKNKTKTFLSYTKVEKTPEIDYFIFQTYFESSVNKTIHKYGKGTPIGNLTTLRFLEGSALKTLKSGDSIRIKNSEETIKNNKQMIFEYILLDMFHNLLKSIYTKKKKYAFYLYTLMQIRNTSIADINNILLKYIDSCIEWCNKFTKINEIISNAYQFIEQNKYLIQYEDRELYPHQKQLFRIINNNENPKLILYTAPTGTGKTLSPIGLSEKKRIIFVCVARHIGLALAKSAISVNKKVAFAFGCETASDIRLHYYAAVDYTINKRSGGIGKVDNSVGDNVEIMICDVQSYLTAMYYMLSFNTHENIITYWDEPTITMDYENHELHDVISKNWRENKIPTIVLSSATMPSKNEIQSVYDDYLRKFENAEIHTISSHDCKKSIPLLNKDGYCDLPHYLYKNHMEMLQCVNHCNNNKTLLRYFDLREIVRFIEYTNEHITLPDTIKLNTYFENISNITMNKVKEYYLELLSYIDENDWNKIYEYMISTRESRVGSQIIEKMKSLDSYNKPKPGSDLKKLNSVFSTTVNTNNTKTTGGVLATTKDAYTFTDGPTIYLTDEIDKIGQFYIQQTKIPTSIFEKIKENIDKNGDLITKIENLESMIENKESKVTNDNKVVSARESGRLSKESENWTREITRLRKEIKLVSLDPMYVPNTIPHQNIWAPNGEIVENAFISDIGEENTKRIMNLNIETKYKVLMLLGIGTFKLHENKEYMEIMKQLADNQKLYMIIASTDYIYGTNYQFCHGFIGKDLSNVSQQKIYQSMGRVGRNNIQQDYTIRFRDNDMIRSLFIKPTNNLEAKNMSRLFNSN